MLTRAISGAVYIVIFIFCILFSKESYSILITLFSLIALYEFKKLISFKNILPYLVLGITFFLFLKFSENKKLLFLLILTIICFVRLLIHIFSEKEKKYPIIFLDKLDLSVRYIIFPFAFLMLLPQIKGNYEPYIVIYSLIIIWTNDTFAYLTGINFGKTKLFERISPKKTVEGFFGGLLFSLIAGFIIGKFFHPYPILDWVVIASLISVFGTLGDLVESKFKRQANVKDSGNIMPGHGGILDRLDSLLFATPFVYLYVHYFLG